MFQANVLTKPTPNNIDITIRDHEFKKAVSICLRPYIHIQRFESIKLNIFFSARTVYDVLKHNCLSSIT